MSDRWIRDKDGNIVGKAGSEPAAEPDEVEADEAADAKAVQAGEAEDKAVDRSGVQRKRV